MLLSASVERFSGSRRRNLFLLRLVLVYFVLKMFNEFDDSGYKLQCFLVVCWMSDVCLSAWCNFYLERDGGF